MDQWTVSGSLSPFRPLHRVALHDEAGTELYVSGRTGEVVRDTTSHERIWNWLGANLHWIYPFQLVRHRDLWTDIVVWLSIAGMLLAVTGLAAGLLRWRFKRRYRNGRRSPYLGWARWHHMGGLVAGIFVLTWIFSGLMSMNPWKLFPAKTAAPDELVRFSGASLTRARSRGVLWPHCVTKMQKLKRSCGRASREGLTTSFTAHHKKACYTPLIVWSRATNDFLPLISWSERGC